MALDIVDIFSVGIPEAFLCILVGYMLFRTKLKTRKVIIRTLMSAIVFLVINNYVFRTNINNVVLIAISSALLFTIILRYVFGLTWRQAIVGANITTYIVLAVEVLGLDMSARIIEGLGNNELLTTYRFFVTLPTRIVQILVVWIMYKKNINYSTLHILTYKSIDLEDQEKADARDIMTYSVSALILISSYVNLVVTLNNNQISRVDFNMTLNVILIVTLLFIYKSAKLLSRSFKYQHETEANAVLIELLESKKGDDEKWPLKELQ